MMEIIFQVIFSYTNYNMLSNDVPYFVCLSQDIFKCISLS